MYYLDVIQEFTKLQNNLWASKSDILKLLSVEHYTKDEYGIDGFYQEYLVPRIMVKFEWQIVGSLVEFEESWDVAEFTGRTFDEILHTFHDICGIRPLLNNNGL